MKNYPPVFLLEDDIKEIKEQLQDISRLILRIIFTICINCIYSISSVLGNSYCMKVVERTTR